MISNVQLPKITSTEAVDSNIKNESAVGNGSVQFKNLLDSQMSKAPFLKPSVSDAGLKFSNHAIERIQNRGIQFQPGDMQKLTTAVEKASDKGSKNALVLLGENAFVVSVKNKTVVTAMDKSLMKENVFTNIDSTIIV